MRHILAITIVSFFLLMIAFIFILPYIAGLKGTSGIDDLTYSFIEKFSSLFSGIIGIILGYYFGTNRSS